MSAADEAYREMLAKLKEIQAQNENQRVQEAVMYDPATGRYGALGAWSPAYEQAAAPETKGYNAFMAEATRKAGTVTPYQQALRQSATADKALQGAQMRNLAQSQSAEGMANLAERGGLSSGAAERMGRAGSANVLAQQGQANALFNKSIATGMAEDERNRVGMLSAAPGAELARAENAQGEVARKNAFQQGSFQSALAGSASQRLANTQKKIAEDDSGGSWLCTLNKQFIESTILPIYTKLTKELKLFALDKNADVLKFYLRNGVILAGRMQEKSEDLEKELDFIKDAMIAMARKEKELAYDIYFTNTKILFNKYCPDIELPKEEA